ncbi:hypothetical protein SODALDRAFT_361257 [Sodiomyces alkalinus F11]|uniref:Uncharacterized protein n=1 Tax=Sodiomyces alkalinus (strain CBS 110278 / VKM F-3762 / F11) TaxID=1314773 RepID=A0A3N2PT01_SODAK|nr:hypothetical protein SODALDRAFT_361257 [Sodiomyces alkalinus F11]ROT37544.1 hypothetical protein SODALDRAFT_361257 [Sodiomyces alkalinus F11]
MDRNKATLRISASATSGHFQVYQNTGHTCVKSRSFGCGSTETNGLGWVGLSDSPCFFTGGAQRGKVSGLSIPGATLRMGWDYGLGWDSKKHQLQKPRAGEPQRVKATVMGFYIFGLKGLSVLHMYWYTVETSGEHQRRLLRILAVHMKERPEGWMQPDSVLTYKMCGKILNAVASTSKQLPILSCSNAIGDLIETPI